jgi:hypothetical protein
VDGMVYLLIGVIEKLPTSHLRKNPGEPLGKQMHCICAETDNSSRYCIVVSGSPMAFTIPMAPEDFFVPDCFHRLFNNPSPFWRILLEREGQKIRD